ncbi:DMT family transporter [Sulfurospirillum sp. T05]|uniref:DMT family transporter n=1 Tax=Sulfurospirillum tamanense TaxID=2813362 RepID=A0ABS2WSI1_9BACT|nr:DMT family transporter [Sulfurospirillum tamanensis]MBN2964581.1 DMT family transporter [Sulfurospirillum tamanensis]
MEQKNSLYAMLFLAMLCWGGSWVNIKVLSGYIGAYDVVFFRYFITALSMVPIILFLKKSFAIDLRSFGLVVLTSLALIAYMNYFFLGTKYGTASLGGAMVTSLIPINTFLLLALLRVRTITKKDLFALILGALGVLTMLDVWHFDMAQLGAVHNLYFLIASLLWPVVTILSSKATKISPIVFTFYMYVITTAVAWAFFVDVDALDFSTYDGIFWLNMLFIAFGASTFANTIYFLGIERLGAREVSSFIFLVPFAAISLSILFLGESISLSLVIGTALTLFAVKLLNNISLRKRRTRA